MGVVVAAIDETSRAVLDCVCAAFEEAERPVCECYGVVGTPVVAFCCECSTGKSGSAILQIEQVYDADPNTLERVSRVNCRRSTRAIDLTIWVTRCYPTIDESGEFNVLDVDLATSEVHEDMDILYNALACCSSRLSIRRIAVDSNPTAGCSMIVGQVTVEVRPTTVVVGS